jgi:hypothetical protein
MWLLTPGLATTIWPNCNMRKTERKKQEKCRKRHPVQPLFERACKNLNIEGDKEMTTLVEAISLKGRTIETVNVKRIVSHPLMEN